MTDNGDTGAQAEPAAKPAAKKAVKSNGSAPAGAIDAPREAAKAVPAAVVPVAAVPPTAPAAAPASSPSGQEEPARVQVPPQDAAAAPPVVKKAKAPSVKPIPPIPPRPSGLDRSLSPEELQMERDRIYARLTSINNVVARPSPADYIVFEVADPVAVHKKLVNLGIPPDVVQKYPKVPNGMRIFVRTARKNEEFIRALEQAVK